MRTKGTAVLDSGNLQAYCSKCLWKGLIFIQDTDLMAAINAADGEVQLHVCPPKPKKVRVSKKKVKND